MQTKMITSCMQMHRHTIVTIDEIDDDAIDNI